MNDPTFRTIFQAAFASDSAMPYDYQCRLACGERGKKTEAEWLSGGTEAHSRLINIPTGLGKTAAVVLAWLWNRFIRQDPAWPRRLVYCLPMRTLVEQTRDNIFEWLVRLSYTASPDHEKVLHAAEKLPEKARKRFESAKAELRKFTAQIEHVTEPLFWLLDHSPIILMGGEDAGEWDTHPEREAILIGTQDMLLSRALNRGYGMSRYRWPMHFGLLNNDALWVMDETQLMGVGVETSAQLNGFRSDEKIPTVGACPTWWMSATLDGSRFATVDHREIAASLPTEELSKEEKEKPDSRPKALFEAKKSVSKCALALSAALKGGDYAKQFATLIAERHAALLEKPQEQGTLTLVVVNRVSRAREIFQALTVAAKSGKQPLCDPARVALVHSRFRRGDRKKHEALLFGNGDRIVIATQAVEAGVDVSARLLITELAPWSSLVQRMGRCNRRAEFSDAEVLWVDIEPDAKGELLLPYTLEELAKARDAITPLTDASPRSLKKRGETVAEEKIIRPVIRRRDLVDLFDTTPDICGQDLDIARYIRDGDDNDVQFFWRDIAEKASPSREDNPPPHRDELCRVSIGDAKKFFDKMKDTRAWRWNALEKSWEKDGKPRPGGVYLLAASAGGYSGTLGWTGEPQDKPTPHPPASGRHETHDGDPDTWKHEWLKLDRHTEDVVCETAAITSALALADGDAATLRTAAWWHDVGKAHGEFQKMLINGDATREGTLWAKSANKDGKCSRIGFRHELASALAWLLAGPPDAHERDLVSYLIAAHHGKVRLSIRSLPNEPAPDTAMPDGAERLFARGIWHGDKLPAVPLAEITTPEVALDLSFMQMGEGPRGESQEASPSWLARTIALRDRLGPFRLAYLETILRAADARASAQKTTAPIE